MRNDYGLWGLVVVNAALFGLFLLTLLRPARRHEWRSFGVVAAFLVALFTEMYGVPLTIYLLTALLGRAPFADPLSHMSGNLIASLLGLGPTWAAAFMMAGGIVMLAGFVVVASGWRRVHAADGELVTSGPYAVVRHPQYAGLLLTIAGALIQWPTLLTLLMAPVLAVTYYRLARREEQSMLERFGDRYARYMAEVPMLVPRSATSTQPTPPRQRDRQPSERGINQ